MSQNLTFKNGLYELFRINSEAFEVCCSSLRIEQLFPLHLEKLQQVINRYPNAKKYVWAQEEPENMGAWSFMLQRFKLVNLEVASQPVRAVPAAGSSARFKRRHQRIIDSVFN